MKIFLDDERNAPIGWVRTYTVGQTIEYLKYNTVTEISLDHDLGLGFKPGYNVLLWIEDRVYTEGYIPPKIRIHTANPSARHKMELAVANIEKRSKCLI